MRHRHLFVALLVAAGCSFLASDPRPSPGAGEDSVQDGASGTGEPDRPRLSRMLVKDSVLGYAPGDTVHVALDQSYPTHSGAMTPLYTADGGDQIGTVASGLLGPLPGGVVVVASEALNVRVCPSTSCRAAGQLSAGETVTAWEYRNGWYRLGPDRSETGYFAHADHLVVPDAYQYRIAAEIRDQTRQFYDRRLSRISDRRGTLFTGWSVELEDRALDLRFHVRDGEGSGLRRVCEATRMIADFARDVASGLPAAWIRSVRASIHERPPGVREPGGRRLAAVSTEGEVECVGDARPDRTAPLRSDSLHADTAATRSSGAPAESRAGPTALAG